MIDIMVRSESKGDSEIKQYLIKGLSHALSVSC